jgi:hypothetical protein
VQSEQVEVRAPVPTLASLDEEFGGTNMEVAPELEYQPGRRRRRYVWFLLPSAVLAVSSAVIWPNNALKFWSLTQFLPSFSAEQTASRSISGSLEAPVDLGALKNEVSELRYGQQKISAEMTALQSAQQELQRSSVKVMSWYSEPNALLHQQPAPNSKAVAVRDKKASTQPRPATQEANAESRNRNMPLPLVRSQTTEPDAVPNQIERNR